jgi:glycine/D-amino acid oxidase-like deaminating enzyme
MNPVTDVAVIGAGIVGCCVAFHLAQMGKRVTVIEKGSIAAGMTKRSGALVRAFFSDEPTARLANHSLNVFQNWGSAIGGDCGYKQSGLFVTVGSDADAEQLWKNAEMLASVGVKVRMFSADRIHDVEPSAQILDVASAAYEPEAGFIDPVTATQSLATRAKEMGARFQTGTLARAIRVERNRVVAVETNAGLIHASAVVVSAGPWSDRLLKPLGIEIRTSLERHQVAFFNRPEELKSGHAAFLDFAGGAYFRPHTFGLTLGGLILEKTESATSADQLDESVSQEFVSQVQSKIAVRLPALASAKFLRGHAGYYDTTPDGHPVLGNAPGYSGLAIAAGFSGIGLTLAPAVGRSIAELLVDGETSTADLSPFRLSRFKENQLLPRSFALASN